MANWVPVRGNGRAAGSFFVNLDVITHIMPDGRGGSLLYFASGASLPVLDSPEELVVKPVMKPAAGG